MTSRLHTTRLQSRDDRTSLYKQPLQTAAYWICICWSQPVYMSFISCLLVANTIDQRERYRRGMLNPSRLWDLPICCLLRPHSSIWVDVVRPPRWFDKHAGFYARGGYQFLLICLSTKFFWCFNKERRGRAVSAWIWTCPGFPKKTILTYFQTACI